MEQGANILLFSKSLTPSNSMYIQRKPSLSNLISISSYSLLYSGIVAFLQQEMRTLSKRISQKKSHFGQYLKENLKFASQANSKHIFTGQKNSALVSLQFSRLATVRGKLFRMLEVKVKLPRGDFPEKTPFLLGNVQIYFDFSKN